MDFLSGFWDRVAEGAPDECWEWVGARCSGDWDYGYLTPRGRHQKAHRVAWELTNRCEIPAGLVVRHACDNPPCCNPNHLSLGTNLDNARDAVARGRRPQKITLDQFAEICRQYRAKYVQGPTGHWRSNANELSEEFGVTAFYIKALVNGQETRVVA